MFYIPEWVYKLDTKEKVIAYLEFFGREDLISKYKTKGSIYLDELLSAPEPVRQVDYWDFVPDSEDQWIDFISWEEL